MKIEFTPRAQTDLGNIRAWFSKSDPSTADRIISRIRQTVVMFENFPLMGRAGEVPGKRECKVTGLPYIIIHALTPEGNIDIVTVVHTRRNYP